ncbi:alpha/beta fold hydrolase [soil metagenome]
MPVLVSQFQPPTLLRNGHLQTILPAFLPLRHQTVREHEKLDLADGDFLDLYWIRSSRKRLAIVSHGLEGSADALYIRSMSAALKADQWDVLTWNYRGCGAETNRLLRSYHSGESNDLRIVTDHAAGTYEEVVLIGFSLGGNITLKYLGEASPHHRITRAAAVSAPVDLKGCAQVLDELPTNRFYLHRFLKSLIAKMELKARLFPGKLDITNIRSIRSFREFDDRYTAPLHGFKDAEDYWARASSLPHLPKITVPALLLNARNDPFLSEESFPQELAEKHACLFLEAPASGGHVGFLDGLGSHHSWAERRIIEFLR